MIEIWRRIGWLGVDLFFVLSGFLISGLLFAEYIRNDRIDVARFWARRGFRIYPPFLALIGVSEIVSRFYKGGWIAKAALIHELTWTQNYKGGITWQTWSLAVEEHFYFVLPIFLWWLARRDRENRLSSLPKIIVSFAFIELLLRIVVTARAPEARSPILATHLRADSLFCGVLIAYFYHFHRIRLEAFAARTRWLLIVSSVCCLIPAVVWNVESPMMRTIGLTLSYLAFGQMLLLGIAGREQRVSARVAPPIQALAAIGRWSYSIYLWHVLVLLGIETAAPKVLGISKLPLPGLAVAYIAGSIAVGWLAHAAIEQPAIVIRDRVLPRSNRRAVTLGAAV